MTFAQSLKREQQKQALMQFNRRAYWQSEEFGFDRAVIDYWNTTLPVVVQYGRLLEWDEVVESYEIN